jgi:hypothetical protein
MFYPKYFACIKGSWTQYVRHANLGVLAKLAQLLECVPQAVDVRKMWSKWRLMVGAMNTKVRMGIITSFCVSWWAILLLCWIECFGFNMKWKSMGLFELCWM